LGNAVLCGDDVLLRQAGPEVPVLAAGSCRFGCTAVGFDAGDIVDGELLPGSEHLVDDCGSSPRAAWLCAPIMQSNRGRFSNRNLCGVSQFVQGSPAHPGFSNAVQMLHRGVSARAAV